MNEEISNQTLKEFFASGRESIYRPGELILVGDDAEPGVHYISKGAVKIYSIDDDGEEYVHIIYGPGDTFPLIWALLGVRRHVFYEALETCTVWMISRKEFLSHIEVHTDKVTYALLYRMADQFNVYADRVDNLQYRSARERVVYRLLFLASRFGKKDGKKVIIDVASITHKVIAQSINLARESVTRELDKLAEKDLIERSSGKIVIKDIEKLKDEFSEPVSPDLWGLSG